MAGAANLNGQEIADLRSDVIDKDYSTSDPRKKTSFVFYGKVLNLSTLNRTRLNNILGKLQDTVDVEFFDDVDVDGFTEANILEASALVFRTLVYFYGLTVASAIFLRLPTRLFLCGLHSGSNKDTQLGVLEDFGDTEREELRNALTERKIPENDIDGIVEQFGIFIPYGAFADVINHLGGKVSKRMLMRIFTIQMHSLAAEGRTTSGVFYKSMLKYEIDLDQITVPNEWLYYGADLHPQFPHEHKKQYKEIQKFIFAKALENATEAAPFNPL